MNPGPFTCKANALPLSYIPAVGDMSLADAGPDAKFGSKLTFKRSIFVSIVATEAGITCPAANACRTGTLSASDVTRAADAAGYIAETD